MKSHGGGGVRRSGAGGGPDGSGTGGSPCGRGGAFFCVQVVGLKMVVGRCHVILAMVLVVMGLVTVTNLAAGQIHD